MGLTTVAAAKMPEEGEAVKVEVEVEVAAGKLGRWEGVVLSI